MCKHLKSLARPEGLEPPTFRFEVYHGAQREVIREKETPRKQGFIDFGYGSFPPLPHHFGNNLETTKRQTYGYPVF